MFGFKKNVKPVINAAPAVSEEIYVMPEKFHARKSQRSSNKILLISVIILVAVAGASGAYFLYDSWQNNQAVTPASINQNVAVVNQNLNINENRNVNINGNLNDNENLNENTNTNVNLNENLNANLNTNLNTNTNSNLNTNQNITPLPSSDADRDGLTDLEESLIGSSPSSPDTDKDSYLDGEEIANGYNPLISSSSGQPAKLDSATYISQLASNFPNDNFKTFYIKGWSLSFIEVLHEARVVSGTGEMIRISVINNTDKTSAANWYLLDPDHTQVTLSQLEKIEFKDFKGVYAPDGLSAYLTDSKREKIYIFEYDLDNMAEFRYPAIFEMMIRSFEFIPGAVSNPTLTPTSTDSSL